jgi:hypothetical protein
MIGTCINHKAQEVITLSKKVLIIGGAAKRCDNPGLKDSLF